MGRAATLSRAAVITAAVLVVYSLAAGSAQASHPSPHSLGAGAWSWFGDPRAVYFDGRSRRTYAGWVSRDGDIVISSHDHDSHRLSTRVLHGRLGRDDHSNPSLQLMPDGRVMAFYSGHRGSRLYYRVMRRPEDVSSFGEEQVAVDASRTRFGVTYPNPTVLTAEGNRMWLFFRGGGYQPAYTTSADGVQWAPPRTLIRAAIPGKEVHRPYVKVASNGVDTVHFAFTEAHPAVYRTSIYYASYRDGRFLTAAGREIATVESLPFTPGQAEVVHDARAGGFPTWIYDLALDADQRPVLVYTQLRSARDHRYRYARWTGDRWFDTEIVRAGPGLGGGPSPTYSAGLSLDHEDPSTVYLSRKVKGEFEIERWRTPDGGATWSRVPITRASKASNLRPVAPRGLLQGEVVMWMRGRYPGHEQYRTAMWMNLP